MAKPKYRSPIGRAKYPHLKEPDTAFDTDKPKYKTELVLSAEAAKPFIDQINKAAEDVHGKQAAGKVRFPFTKDEDTGEVSFKFSSKYQPAFSDTTGETIPPSQLPKVGAGSSLIVSGVINVYEVNKSKGVGLLLDGVQIVDIVEYGGGNISFDAVEGGTYVRESVPVANGNATMPPVGDDGAKFDF